MIGRSAARAAGAVVAAIALSSCGGDGEPRRGTTSDAGAAEIDPAPGRLTARPDAGPTGDCPAGVHSLARGSLLYVPEGSPPRRGWALVVALHGAGGSAENGLGPFTPRADELGLVLVAPQSRRQTWDVIRGGYGADVALIDDLLEETFARCAIDPLRIGIGGFSDGASYALSLGVTNGDLFSAILAFSPGFNAPAAVRGSPIVFVSHGASDPVLPVAGARRIVGELRGSGYDVRYREFFGGHTVPPAIAREAAAILGVNGR